MTSIRFDFPTLIEQRSDQYTIRPLLMDGVTARHRRYGDAVRAFQKEIKKHYNDLILERDRLEEVLWYRYHPDVHFQLLNANFKAGMGMVNGTFAVAHYKVKGQRYCCFPKLEYLTVRLNDDLETKPQREAFLVEQIMQYFRRLRKDRGVTDINYKLYESDISDSNSSLAITVNIQEADFKFAQSMAGLFSLFGANESFNGASELNQVAQDLSLNYPDAMEIALYRDESKEWVRRALFNDIAQPVVVIGPSGIGKSNLIQSAYRDHIEPWFRAPRPDQELSHCAV